MTTTAEVRDAFTSISNTLAAAITVAQGTDDPAAALVAHIDQVRAFVDAMAKTLDLQPAAAITAPVLQCSACIQDQRNAEANGEPPKPILPAATVVNGLALCDVEGRHRIVTAVQAAVAQRSSILLPGQNGQMPPGMMS